MSLQAEFKKKFSGFALEVALQTERGVLGLLGASGSGKSMTLKCIAGIETPDEGRIVLNGRVLFDSERKINLSPQERRVGYLFQNYALFPNMTVETNIGAGIRGSRKECAARVEEMIHLFRLEGLEKRYPSQLSGGQQQRVALARILAYRPDVIMLDEPFSALDYYLKEQLQFQVKEVLKEYKGDVLLVTHSRDEVYRFCENSMILDQGRVVTSGTTEGIFRYPENVTAARLTGCKNISRIQKLGSRRVLALDWGIPLTLAEEPGDEITSIGIRAHQFGMLSENAFSCVWDDTLKQPFEWDILVKSEGDASKEPIWWKLDVSQTGILDGKQVGDRLSLGVKPEDILLLKE